VICGVTHLYVSVWPVQTEFSYPFCILGAFLYPFIIPHVAFYCYLFLPALGSFPPLPWRFNSSPALPHFIPLSSHHLYPMVQVHDQQSSPPRVLCTRVLVLGFSHLMGHGWGRWVDGVIYWDRLCCFGQDFSQDLKFSL
jgi:hypothetical protein